MTDAEMYDKLATTAKSFMHSMLPQTLGTTDFDSQAILSYLDPSFHMDWGHSFFVATMPPLQGEKTGEGFVAHMQGMAKSLQTWTIDVTTLSVDPHQKTVVIRADFNMSPKGGEPVLSDIIFWMVLDESGEKLVRCTEFVDPVASKELGEWMRAGIKG